MVRAKAIRPVLLPEGIVQPALLLVFWCSSVVAFLAGSDCSICWILHLRNDQEYHPHHHFWYLWFILCNPSGESEADNSMATIHHKVFLVTQHYLPSVAA